MVHLESTRPVWTSCPSPPGVSSNCAILADRMEMTRLAGRRAMRQWPARCTGVLRIPVLMLSRTAHGVTGCSDSNRGNHDGRPAPTKGPARPWRLNRRPVTRCQIPRQVGVAVPDRIWIMASPARTVPAFHALDLRPVRARPSIGRKQMSAVQRVRRQPWSVRQTIV